MPGAFHDDDDNEPSIQQFRSQASRWNNSGKAADIANHSYQDARQNQLQDGARTSGRENSYSEKGSCCLITPCCTKLHMLELPMLCILIVL